MQNLYQKNLKMLEMSSLCLQEIKHRFTNRIEPGEKIPLKKKK